MVSLCMISSLILGLLAWALPVAGMAARKKPAPICAGSFALCGFSLLLQLVYVKHLSRIGDYSALDDTIGAVVFAAEVLLIIAAAVNTAALLAGRKR